MHILNKKHLNELFHKKFVYMHYFFLLFTTRGLKLIKPPTEVMISSSKSTIHLGITDPSILNFLSCPITRSTCIRKWAICQDISTSLAVNCFFSRVKAGILKTAPRVASSSSIKKCNLLKCNHHMKPFLKNLNLMLSSCLRHVYPTHKTES